MVRHEALVKESESSDLMAAALSVQTPDKEDTRNASLEKVKVCGHVELLMAKLKTLADDMSANTAAAMERCQVLFTEGIADAANNAKNDLTAKKAEVQAKLQGCREQLQKLLADEIKAMTTVAELDQAKKVADDLFKATKADQRSFNYSLGAFKKMLSTVERERKLSKAACDTVRVAEPAPPLYTILKAIVESSEREANSSLFEAKHGVTGVLLNPAVPMDR